MFSHLKLKEFLESRPDISKAGLAKILGISSQSLYNYMNGVHEPPYSLVIKIEKLYGLQPGVFTKLSSGQLVAAS